MGQTQAGTLAASRRLGCGSYLNLHLYSDLRKQESWHEYNMSLVHVINNKREKTSDKDLL